MNVWIYDEYCCPSGFAGGLVPDAMPESLGRGLVIREQESVDKLDENAVAVFRLTEGGYENVSSEVRAGVQLPKGRFWFKFMLQVLIHLTGKCVRVMPRTILSLNFRR